MPLRYLRCYIGMHQLLAAEQSLRRVAELQAADGTLEPRDRQAIVRAWQQVVHPPETQRKPTKEEFMASMSALGFTIEAD